MGWAYNTPDNVANDGPRISVVAVVLTIVSLSILLLRLYVRGYMLKAVGADDYVLCFSWIAACGFAVVSILQTKWGLGLKSLEDMPDVNVYNFGLVQYIGAPFYISSILGFKISLLLTYIRFMTQGLARTATITVIVTCVLFHLSFLLVQVNLCQPAAKQWDPNITGGSCLPAVPFYTSMASMTIVFDIIVMLLPYPVLLRSHVQKRKKLVLLGLLALGVFITIIQVIRIQTIKHLANYLDSASLIMWSTVENNMGIIVASIPTLAPLFKYFAEKTQKGSGAYSTSHPRSSHVLKSGPGASEGVFPRNSGAAIQIYGPGEDGGSEEFILGDVTSITKKTEVKVITYDREEADKKKGK
ncbi:integral membrane protein [Stagonosporopsis vannaccii]|nr:integral membrane protein [Stagonosporopsis vannaccii]